MIPALACLLFPLGAQCGDFVRDAPSIASVAAHRAQYNGRILDVTGRVQRLDQWRSRRGRSQQVFQLCDGACVRVYMPAHSAIHNGQLVTVRGTYYESLHLDRSTYDNELEATEVLPRE
jgi:hypothetical protein